MSKIKNFFTALNAPKIIQTKNYLSKIKSQNL